jgi:signal peptidase I
MAKQAKDRPRAWWKKAWHFLWYEDSLTSWLVNIAVAFLLIKFALYPGLGLLLGTPFPVVAVVSSSMEHHPGSFDAWWGESEDFYLKYNITKFDFLTYPFRGGFRKGDIMILRGADPGSLRKGTVIVYWSPRPYPIIHRYIGTNVENGTPYLMTKGDNNPAMVIQPRDLDERHILPDKVVGQAFLRIPYLGWVKILAVNAFTCPAGRGTNQGWGACLLDGPQG